MKKKTQLRFPLLPYQILAKRWRGPAFWLIPAGLVLWWLGPRTEILNTRLAPVALVISALGVLLLLYTLFASQAHIRCYHNHFKLKTPFYPIAFSYQRVTMVRPVEFGQVFPQEKEKAARLRLYRPLWGKTAIIVDLKGYPLPEQWLRLWVHPYLIHPKENALVLSAEDWMGLSRALEGQRSTWLEARRQRH